MNQRLNMGLAIKILSDTITLSSLNEVDGNQFYESNKKKISRMGKFDLSKMTDNDFDKLIDFSKRIDRWAEWAKGVTPSWNMIKLFFDNDLSLPIEYFIDDNELHTG